VGKLEIFHDKDEGWLSGEDAVSEGMKNIPDRQENTGGERRIRHEGSDTDLQLFECRVAPNQHIETHAHTEDEIIYVLGGSMRFGAHVLTAGSSIYIPGLTLYAFDSGPDGLQFINFRPRQDETHYSKEQFMQMRAAAKAG
jgi:hypothetical protein